MFKNRSTTDTVVILFALMIGTAMVMAIAGAFYIKIKYPTIDTSKLGELIGNVVTTIVGALVGFIGGRATGRSESNGNGNHKIT